MQNFRTYQLAIQFYHDLSGLKLPSHLKQQLLRAGSSVVLNLAEGAGKREYPKEQKRFYVIAMGSFRESQAILQLAKNTNPELHKLADALGGCLYKLTKC